MTVKIKKEILDELEQVRASGVVNMFDRTTVATLVDAKTRDWIEDNPKKYCCGIMQGFEAIEAEEENNHEN